MEEKTNNVIDINSTQKNVITVKSPLTGEVIGKVPSLTIEEVLPALERARAAQKEWAKTSLAYRRRKILAFLEVLYKHSDEVASLIANESGKTLFEANLFEVIPIMHLTAYFADKAEKILRPKEISISVFKNRASYIHYKPRGIVFVISPWNFPFSIPVGEVVMALLAGNAVLLKPASLTPLIAYKARELFDEAGLDKNLFQVISGPGKMASQLIESGVDYVNFTGSTAVGKKVSELCGKYMIPCSMELGGKAPALVMPNADLNMTVQSIVWGAFANSGQVCASVERVYVHESLYEEFVKRAAEITKSLRQGNTLTNTEIDIGSMTDPNQIEFVETLLEDAKSKGARILTGGKRSSAGKMFFEPTIIVDVNDSMRVMHEESFGPLMPITKFSTEDKAIEMANDSHYGLLAYVFARDKEQGKRIAERIAAGTVMINETLMTHAFPETPWGGVKESGVGFVHSDDGLKALTQAYHVNYDLLSVENPVWYPYGAGKINRFISGAQLFHRRVGIGGKLKALGAIFSGKKLD